MGLVSGFYKLRPSKGSGTKKRPKIMGLDAMANFYLDKARNSKRSTQKVREEYDNYQGQLAKVRIYEEGQALDALTASGLSGKDLEAARRDIRLAQAKRKGRTHTFIYALVDPRDGKYRYIGKSNYPRIRYQQHLDDMNKCNYLKTAWLREMSVLGLKPELIVLEKCLLQDWKERERSWIKNRKTQLVNLTDGGDGN